MVHKLTLTHSHSLSPGFVSKLRYSQLQFDLQPANVKQPLHQPADASQQTQLLPTNRQLPAIHYEPVWVQVKTVSGTKEKKENRTEGKCPTLWQEIKWEQRCSERIPCHHYIWDFLLNHPPLPSTHTHSRGYTGLAQTSKPSKITATETACLEEGYLVCMLWVCVWQCPAMQWGKLIMKTCKNDLKQKCLCVRVSRGLLTHWGTERRKWFTCNHKKIIRDH